MFSPVSELSEVMMVMHLQFYTKTLRSWDIDKHRSPEKPCYDGLF